MREVQEERRRAVRAVLVDVARDHVLGLGLEERRRIPAQAAPYNIIRKLHIEMSRPALFFRTTTGCCSGVSVCVWVASSVAVPPGRAGGRARDRDSNQDAAACGGGDADDDALVIRGEADAVAVEVVERLVQAAGDDRGARATAVVAVRLWGGEVAAIGGTRRGESRGAAVVVARRTRGESFLLSAWKKRSETTLRARPCSRRPQRAANQCTSCGMRWHQ